MASRSIDSSPAGGSNPLRRRRISNSGRIRNSNPLLPPGVLIRPGICHDIYSAVMCLLHWIFAKVYLEIDVTRPLKSQERIDHQLDILQQLIENKFPEPKTPPRADTEEQFWLSMVKESNLQS